MTFLGRRPGDLSGHAHRRLIGLIGLVFPLFLYVMAGVRPTDGLDRWHPLDSISAYAHTGASEMLVGLLVVLGLFLFTHRGYRGAHERADRVLGFVAGAAALGVAFFPNQAPEGLLGPDWWTPAMGIVHYSSAVALFVAFALYSLWLFRLGDDVTPDKRARNRVYLVCGVAIVAGMVWAGIAGFLGASIFIPEALMLFAFAVSWLVKGRALEAIALAFSEGWSL